MAQLLVILKGPNRKAWFVGLMVMTAVGLGTIEVWRPGTIASIPAWIVRSAILVWTWMGNVLDAFRELIRDISGWYG